MAGYKHYLSEIARTLPGGITEATVATTRAQYDALPQNVRGKHERTTIDLNEVRRLGGRGFAYDKKMQRRKDTADHRGALLDTMSAAANVDPTSNVATRASDDIDISKRVDFDGGVRKLRRGFRNAASAGNTALAVQDKLLASHNIGGRRDGGSQ
jgi:hypothetical protein